MNISENIDLRYGDCLEIMPNIPSKSVDMILCDLPYGTTACKWDIVIPFNLLWEQYERIIKDNGAIVLTASQPFSAALVMSNPKMFKYALVYEKPCPSNPLLAQKRVMSFHEDILIFYKKHGTYNAQKVLRHEKDKRKNTNIRYSAPETLGFTKIASTDNTSDFKHPSSVLKFNRETGLHPTQKPVPLFEFLIKTYTNEGDLVLDNCLGSGTTAIACHNLKRRCIGIEKELEYFEIAKKRLQDVQRVPMLF